MAWSFVGSGENQGSGLSASITHSLTINANDLVCLYVNYNNDTGSMTPQVTNGATWTTAVEEVPSSETAQQAFYYKTANGTEDDPYTVSLGTSAQWGAVLLVFRGSNAPTVDAAINTARRSTQTTSLVMTAANGETVSDGAVSVLFGGMDARDGSGTGYGAADNSYLENAGTSGASQAAGGVYRIYATGQLINFDVTMSSGADPNDNTYSAHMSFLDTAAGTTIEVPVGPWR